MAAFTGSVTNSAALHVNTYLSISLQLLDLVSEDITCLLVTYCNKMFSTVISVMYGDLSTCLSIYTIIVTPCP